MLKPTADELWNTLTHAAGFLLSVVGAAWLLVAASSQTQVDEWRMAGCGVYCASLASVYFCSTLSHSASRPDQKQRWRQLDQAFIYLLIVGTYTPFGLAYLRTGGWLWFLVAMWLLALLGFFSKLLFAHRVEAVAVWIYVILGWMPIVTAYPLLYRVPSYSLWWMLIGGIVYTAGTWFLMNDRKAAVFHPLWHLFVMGGSACHFYAIYHGVVQVP
ncbi:MAG: hemolysin III family protein [Pirellulales bacterium]